MKKLTTEEFIEKARLIHGDKYNYEYSNCNNSKDKVKIICIKHNHEFIQQAGSHLSGCGCPLCGNEKKTNFENYN